VTHCSQATEQLNFEFQVLILTNSSDFWLSCSNVYNFRLNAGPIENRRMVISQCEKASNSHTFCSQAPKQLQFKCPVLISITHMFLYGLHIARNFNRSLYPNLTFWRRKLGNSWLFVRYNPQQGQLLLLLRCVIIHM
jgi:hypothetical protein